MIRSIIRPLLLIALLTLSVFAQSVKPQTVTSKITQVTVYPEWAYVTRQASVSLSPGTTRLAVHHLPSWIDDESIRVQLKALLQRQAREGSRRLEPLIAAAEKRGDQAEVDRLLAEKTRLRLELAEI